MTSAHLELLKQKLHLHPSFLPSQSGIALARQQALQRLLRGQQESYPVRKPQLPLQRLSAPRNQQLLVPQSLQPGLLHTPTESRSILTTHLLSLYLVQEKTPAPRH